MTTPTTKQNVQKSGFLISIKEYIIMTIGMCIYSFGWIGCVLPAKSTSGAASGLAIVISKALENTVGWEIKIGTIVLCINVVLLIIAGLTLGWKFGIKTIYCIFALSMSMNIWQDILPADDFLHIDRFLSMVDDEYNCLTLCSGSLNANPENNVAKIIRKHCDRIAFAHIRNVKHFPNGDFSEASHRDCDGDTGILEILKAYHACGFEGYIRPDHGRHLWDEGPGNVRPGYGLYDRALGIMYMLGVWDMLDKLSGK